MKTPCSDCITLAACRTRARDLLDGSILSCPIVREYLSVDHCKGMMYSEFRQKRIKKIQKVMGFEDGPGMHRMSNK